MEEATQAVSRFKPCSHCGREERTKNNRNGFEVIETRNVMNMIACPCGIMTGLKDTLEQLECIWNSRPGAIILPVKINVTHAGVRGAEPGTRSSEEMANLEKAITKLNPEMFKEPNKEGDPF